MSFPLPCKFGLLLFFFDEFPLPCKFGLLLPFFDALGEHSKFSSTSFMLSLSDKAKGFTEFPKLLNYFWNINNLIHFDIAVPFEVFSNR